MPRPRHITAELWVVSITFHWLNCNYVTIQPQANQENWNKSLVWDLHIHVKLFQWVIVIIPEIDRKSFLRERERRCRISNTLHYFFYSYSIMTECWEEQPQKRPTFGWLCTAVRRLLDDHKVCKYLLLTECAVRTVSYGPRFFASRLGHKSKRKSEDP